MKLFTPIILLFVLLAAGCAKHLESINTNPNSPDKVSNPGLLLTNVIRSAVNTNFDRSYDRGSVAANMLAEDYASNFTNWARPDATGYFLWNYYDYIRDINEVIKIAGESGQNNYKGIALVLRSWMFQCLTDIYGPIPFREAASAKIEGIDKPKYEQQEAVYAGLLTDLEEANGLLGSSEETVIGDILFNGETDRWKKFADGLMLRLLLRESKRVDPSSQMQNIVNNPSKYPLFTSHSDQAALQYLGDRLDNEQPFYRSGNGGVNTKVSKQLVDYFKSLNDPRLPVYALPTPASLNGTFQYNGALNGVGILPDPENYSPSGMLWMSTVYNTTLTSATAAQAIILSYSEVQFILAEAAEKGYIPGGSAAAGAYYLKGVKDQFSYYSSRIPDTYAGSFLHLSAADVIPPDTYYTQSGVAYAGTQDQKLQKIWLQKWFSLYLVGYEAWSEWRRTGFPAIVAGPMSPGYVPRRCLYPADEMRINEANYNEAVQWLGADDLKSHVWWDK